MHPNSYLSIIKNIEKEYEEKKKKKFKEEKNKEQFENEFRPTDSWNSQIFAETYKNKLLWCDRWNTWLRFEGKWQKDDVKEVLKLAKQVVLKMYEEASRIEDDELRKKLVKHALQSEKRARLEAMIELAKPELAITPERFDKNPYLINLQNGTFDLNSFVFYEHKPEDYLSKMMNVSYNPDADCPRWKEFLNRIFCEQTEIIEFVQKALGYSLTGDTGEDCLFILYGTGSNGKSTFIKTITNIWGDYGLTTPIETFLVKNNAGIPNDIARMAGTRLVIASETPEDRSMNEVLVKLLTGRDKITARFLRQEYFEFEPTFKIWIIGNHKPIIREQTKAIWRRIRLIPFEYVFTEEDIIPNYENILLQEKEGIFNWILEGYQKWKVEGLKPPEKIIKATEEYKSEMDIVGDFIEECCEVGKMEYSCTMKELYKAYCKWCEENGIKQMSQKGFSYRLEEKGFAKQKTRVGVVWNRLKLKDGQKELF